MMIFSLLLHLLPAPFRAEYESELRSIFEQRRRDTQPAVLWLETIADLITTAVRVHFDMLGQDLTFAFRTLGRSPGFTATAIAVAAIGIGATTAGFTMLDHVLLRPLPFKDSTRLVDLYEDETAAGYKRMELSPANFRDW